jgi:hypothetical protein
MLGDLFNLIASERRAKLLGRYLHIGAVTQPGFHLISKSGLLKLIDYALPGYRGSFWPTEPRATRAFAMPPPNLARPSMSRRADPRAPYKPSNAAATDYGPFMRKPFDKLSGMFLGLGGAHSLACCIALAHVRAGLGIAVILVTREVINL